MSFWNGTQWVDETAVAASPKSSRRASWAATAVMVLGLAALIIPFGATSARSGASISVWWTDGSALTSATTPTGDSHFIAGGCRFRANDKNYYLVVYGPAPDTASLAYWVDPFPVGSDGCGSATPSWRSSGVTGTFEVWVVRSPSGNPWQAQPVTNVVEVDVTSL
jgi:hypothetical protein